MNVKERINRGRNSSGKWVEKRVGDKINAEVITRDGNIMGLRIFKYGE